MLDAVSTLDDRALDQALDGLMQAELISDAALGEVLTGYWQVVP